MAACGEIWTEIRWYSLNKPITPKKNKMGQRHFSTGTQSKANSGSKKSNCSSRARRTKSSRTCRRSQKGNDALQVKILDSKGGNTGLEESRTRGTPVQFLFRMVDILQEFRLELQIQSTTMAIFQENSLYIKKFKAVIWPIILSTGRERDQKKEEEDKIENESENTKIPIPHKYSKICNMIFGRGGCT
eukprot:213526-Amorphochlora_amoeboformis.AAC.1